MTIAKTIITMIVNNLSVSYSDEGPVEEPVVIFIHGFPLNISMWDLQLKVLTYEYLIIAYDIQGHGASTRYQ